MGAELVPSSSEDQCEWVWEGLGSLLEVWGIVTVV